MLKSLRQLPPSVVLIGLVSCFNDLASEMVTPLIPVLLAGTAGGAVALGLVEGLAEAVSAVIKLWAGRRSDRAGRRKPFALAGYALSNAVRPLMGLAGGWGQILLLRCLDRVGKGLRSAPRDALLSDAVPPTLSGLAFGLHRAFDNGGAVGGALLAALVLALSGLSLASVIMLSALPGVLALATLAIGVREPVSLMPTKAKPATRLGAIERRLVSLIGLVGLFTLARVAETFVVLRAHELGFSVVGCLLLWAAYSCAKSIAALIGGRWSDRFGHGRFLLICWVVFAAALLLLAQVAAPTAWLVASLVYGLAFGLGEGVERAAVRESADPARQGEAFGWYYLVAGLAAIPGGLAFGYLWQRFGAATALHTAALVAALAAMGLAWWRRHAAACA
jgi:MFS family permease